MNARKRGCTLQVPAESQIGLGFDDAREVVDEPELGASQREIIFKAPDPREVFLGNQRLDRYLVEAGLDDALIIDSLLRSLDIWEQFESAYKPGGRSPIHPRLLIGLILLGLIEGRTSLRGLELLARADVRAFWLCAGLCPDHSTLGKFILRHEDVLTTAFFEELTRKIFNALKSSASRLSGDGTVIEAVASRSRMLKQEAAEKAAAAARANAKAHPDDKALAKAAELAEEVAETARQRSAIRRAKSRKNPDAPVNAFEPEAAMQPLKNKTHRPSYIPSILANEDRLILGQAVDPTHEARMVEPMLEQSKRISDQEVEELLLDANYFNALVIMFCYSADINLLCPQGKSIGGKTKVRTSTKQIPKNQFRYDKQRDEYLCPAGQRLTKDVDGTDREGRNFTQYSCDSCGGCSYRPKCTKRAGGRTIKRYEHEVFKEAQLELMEYPQAQRHYGKRQGMVEPIFSELRYVQGLQRFRRRGLSKVKIEFALHAAAHNVRRYLRITMRLAEAATGDAEAAIQRILMLFIAFWSLSTVIRAEGGSTIVLVTTACDADIPSPRPAPRADPRRVGRG
jgi:transposase